MRKLANLSGLLVVVGLMFGCGMDEKKEEKSQEQGGDPLYQEEGDANITDRDREILDNRDDGTLIEADDGGTEANNDFWDGIGGESKKDDRN